MMRQVWRPGAVPAVYRQGGFGLQRLQRPVMRESSADGGSVARFVARTRIQGATSWQQPDNRSRSGPTISWIRKFGIAASTCMHAVSATGPIAQWGIMWM